MIQPGGATARDRRHPADRFLAEPAAERDLVHGTGGESLPCGAAGKQADELPFIPDPPIARHGVIGDRRTTALVAADGTIDWYCLPHYGCPPIFGALLDPGRGGFWRMGPVQPELGQQRYLRQSRVLLTTWMDEWGQLELTDAMAWPWDERGGDEGGPDGRVVLRRLRCVNGAVQSRLDFQPRLNFATPPPLRSLPDGVRLEVDGRPLTLWVSRPVKAQDDGLSLTVELAAGEELWAVLSWGEEQPRPWWVGRAIEVLAATNDYWARWSTSLDAAGPHADHIRHCASALKLLTYAPTGSPVAAPTTSLPERIGGERNWDYRYTWVRDAALSTSILSLLGDTASGRRHMDCLASYGSASDSPLQILYGVDGALDLPEQKRWDLAGYAGSRPVRFGNRACGQRQLDSLGFFADSALTYLTAGGEWTPEHWHMVRRAADYTAAHWRKPDSGIWEYLEERHYVSGKVMSWVALDRAVTIAARTGHDDQTDDGRSVQAAIHDEVLHHGWSEERQAFRQCYEDDTLDASALLIPIMGFLPVDHPRVVATVERIQEELTVDGFVYRNPASKDGAPVTAREGAFFPCSFWLVTVLAMSGRVEEAGQLLAKLESTMGEVGLIAEQIDPTDRSFLGNIPLLFSHAEYMRALLALTPSTPLPWNAAARKGA